MTEVAWKTREEEEHKRECSSSRVPAELEGSASRISSSDFGPQPSAGEPPFGPRRDRAPLASFLRLYLGASRKPREEQEEPCSPRCCSSSWFHMRCWRRDVSTRRAVPRACPCAPGTWANLNLLVSCCSTEASNQCNQFQINVLKISMISRTFPHKHL